ncbi:hydroxymethylglutaryl-CoA lyase [Antarcticirhabdus aurantiaca]|uniref:Hydroxymethylglutaryl-CoA lyase n=1 Tax=Antarcticirhabdus aurantiaca TaxID=2606717 RepID=A0ACD4NNY4_9HYPH|nr:hydroxymethylglutaryl-CoA lyase [Antarcticirhabdus aurantiaca]WAJ28600.1 hydroxymethylglutaryl-CoA lyase [Jeongeuplla avenae]
MSARDAVRIVEVSPRDGLQNEPRAVSTADKVRLVDLLSQAGFAEIEAASFVSPKRVPQMADGAAVLAGIRRRVGIRYSALAPNLRGFEAARGAGADAVSIFASASEGFSQANIGCSIADSLERFRPVAEAARAAGLPLRGYVSCVTDCPYDGPVAPVAAASVAVSLAELGCAEISLGDTLGRATPETIRAMLAALLAELPATRLAGHFHDTAGRALVNVEASLDLGLRAFDASVAGLGGCPFAPGAAGNVDTLSLHRRLVELGFDTGLDPTALERAAAFARSLRTGSEAAA